MKNQALFSSKDKSKKLICHLLQFLFGALRVKYGWTDGSNFTTILSSIAMQYFINAQSSHTNQSCQSQYSNKIQNHFIFSISIFSEMVHYLIICHWT